MVEDGGDRYSSNTLPLFYLTVLNSISQFLILSHNRLQSKTAVFERCRSASFSVDCSSLRRGLL